MKHDLVRNEPIDVFDLGSFSKEAVLRGIMAVKHDPSAMKERIITAYCYRAISKAEVQKFFREYELKNA